jgi:transcription antitermination factor NusG
VLKKRTLARLKDAEDARDAVAARRDARRKRKGGYAIAPDAAAARRKNQRPIRAAGVSRPRTSGGAKAKLILDVDPAEDEEDEEEKYKVTAPGAEGRRKLNVQRRDLDRQSNFQETMRDEGWYMVAVPEEREERAVSQILSLSGTDKADGATIDAWIPRVPPPGYVASASEASGRTAVQLMQAVPEEGATKPFPGFVLLRMSLNPALLASLDELYAFKGFAVGGITRYGSTRRQTGEAPRTVPKAQMDSMSAMCAVRVVPDDEAERVRAEEKKRAEMAKLAEAMGEMEVASEEDIAAARQSATKTRAGRNQGEDAPEPEENTTPVATPPEGARTVEVHEGPFKGFRGYATNENDDGTVDAKLTIFGRETAVTLEPGEFEFSS